MLGWFARLAHVLMALVVALAPSLAEAKPRRGADGQVRQISARAEKMLDALDFERARELLESTVRKSRFRRARSKSRARLWALLGRARAELGNTVGADEAFREAVRLDRKVRLSRRTSPKIREALERARALAAPAADPEPEPPPRRDEPKVAKAPKPDKPKPPPKAKTPRAERKAKPPRRKRAPRKAQPAPKTAQSAKAAKRAERKGRWLEFSIVGPQRPGATTKIVARHGGLPRRARFEARVRRTQNGKFERLRMTRSGTVAQAKLVLDSPRLEIFVVAKRGRRVLASQGSETAPVVITPVSATPTLAEAWSVEPPPPAAPPPPLPSVQSATVAAPPPTGVTPPPPTQDPSDTSGLGATEITLLAVGGAVVVASVVTAVLLLATRTPRCDVVEGQGCVEVQVVPSSLVRF